MGSGGFAKSAMGVFLEGVQVDSVSTTGPGVFAIRTYVVTVTDGQLNLGFRNLQSPRQVVNVGGVHLPLVDGVQPISLRKEMLQRTWS